MTDEIDDGIADQLHRLERRIDVVAKAVGLMLAASTGAHVTIGSNLLEELGVKPQTIVPGVIVPGGS